MLQRPRRRCEGTAMGAIDLDLRPGLGIGPFSLGNSNTYIFLFQYIHIWMYVCIDVYVCSCLWFTLGLSNWIYQQSSLAELALTWGSSIYFRMYAGSVLVFLFSYNWFFDFASWIVVVLKLHVVYWTCRISVAKLNLGNFVTWWFVKLLDLA